MQALEKLDPGWAREFLPKSGIERDEMSVGTLASTVQFQICAAAAASSREAAKEPACCKHKLEAKLQPGDQDSKHDGRPGYNEHAFGSWYAGAIENAAWFAEPAGHRSNAGLPGAGYVV